MGSSLALVTLAQEPEDSEPAGTDSAALEDRGRPRTSSPRRRSSPRFTSTIRKMYFRPVDEKVLVNGAIEGLLQMVDRNDTFMPDPKDILRTDDDAVGSHTHGLGLILGFANLQSYGASCTRRDGGRAWVTARPRPACAPRASSGRSAIGPSSGARSSRRTSTTSGSTGRRQEGRPRSLRTIPMAAKRSP
jgi:hypothetical protein